MPIKDYHPKEGDIVEFTTYTILWNAGDKAELICPCGDDCWICDFTMNDKYYSHGFNTIEIEELAKNCNLVN